MVWAGVEEVATLDERKQSQKDEKGRKGWGWGEGSCLIEGLPVSPVV